MALLQIQMLRTKTFVWMKAPTVEVVLFSPLPGSVMWMVALGSATAVPASAIPAAAIPTKTWFQLLLAVRVPAWAEPLAELVIAAPGMKELRALQESV